MATHAAKLIAASALPLRAQAVTVCHFTTAHSELKSRSFHREFMPLAAGGFGVRYVAPMKSSTSRDGVDLIALPLGAKATSSFPGPHRASCNTFAPARDPVPLPGSAAPSARLRAETLLPQARHLRRLRRFSLDGGQQNVHSSHSSPSRRKKSLPAIENLAAHCFDGVMTADPFTLRRLAHCGNSRKLVFYNFPNLDLFPPVQRQHTNILMLSTAAAFPSVRVRFSSSKPFISLPDVRARRDFS